MQILSIILLAAGALTLAVLAAAILYGLFRAERRGQIADFLVEVPAKKGEPGKPSVSRLQMLIWNFVVAFAFLYILGSLSLDDALTPETISSPDGGTATTTKFQAALQALFIPQILVLLGISNGTYLLGKLARQGQTGRDTGSEAVKTAVEGMTPSTPAAAPASPATRAVLSVPDEPQAGPHRPAG